MSTSATGDADEARRAVADFAQALSDARQAAGNPSFREMAGRSGCISHTTLHDAMRGSRLPSWETTVEFVKACGFDPLPWRPRWEAAAAIVHPSATRPTDATPPAIPPSTAGTLSAADVPAPHVPEAPSPTSPITVTPGGRCRRRWGPGARTRRAGMDRRALR